MQRERRENRRPYQKPSVQSEQAPEQQILATGTCQYKEKNQPMLPCIKKNA